MTKLVTQFRGLVTRNRQNSGTASIEEMDDEEPKIILQATLGYMDNRKGKLYYIQFGRRVDSDTDSYHIQMFKSKDSGTPKRNIPIPKHEFCGAEIVDGETETFLQRLVGSPSRCRYLALIMEKATMMFYEQEPGDNQANLDTWKRTIRTRMGFYGKWPVTIHKVDGYFGSATPSLQAGSQVLLHVTKYCVSVTVSDARREPMCVMKWPRMMVKCALTDTPCYSGYSSSKHGPKAYVVLCHEGVALVLESKDAEEISEAMRKNRTDEYVPDILTLIEKYPNITCPSQASTIYATSPDIQESNDEVGIGSIRAICDLLIVMLEGGVPQPDTLRLSIEERRIVGSLLYVESETHLNDWKGLASKIGLTSQAVDIIHFFCKSNNLSKTHADVVLRHWQLIYNGCGQDPERCPRPCTRESLLAILDEMDRADILGYLGGHTQTDSASTTLSTSAGAVFKDTEIDTEIASI